MTYCSHRSVYHSVLIRETASCSRWLINKETHSWIMCINCEILEDAAVDGMSLSKPFPQGSGIYAEEEAKRLQEPEVIDDPKETASSNITDDVHMNLPR